MPEKSVAWLEWGVRFRAHVRDKKTLKWGDVAAKAGQAESTIRSWLNGTRKINLEDFFALCAAAEAEPSQILFGKVWLSDDMKKRLGTAIVSVLESDPAANPDYAPFVTVVKKDMKKRGGSK